MDNYILLVGLNLHIATQAAKHLNVILSLPQIQSLAMLGNNVKITPSTGDNPIYTVMSKLDNYVIQNLKWGGCIYLCLSKKKL